jgi:4-amino-4-deoxy-L-arabinose transferase-like glycosyltransferase
VDSALSKKILGIPAGWILLLLLFCFHCINNAVILSKDNTPLVWDSGDYFNLSLKYFDVFSHIDGSFISRFNAVSPYRPPLFLISSLPLYVLFGRSPDVAVMTNILYLAILIFSVYGIGKYLHSESTGLMAGLVATTFPILFGLSRSYWLDFPLTAMVALSIFLLLKTESFSNRWYSILFGISAGLGMLTKWTWFIFVAGPLIYFICLHFQNRTKEPAETPRFRSNLILSLITAAVVSSVWYVPNGMDVAGKLLGLVTGMKRGDATQFEQLGETIGPPGIWNLRALTYYAGQFVNHQATFITSCLFVFFALLLLKRSPRKTIWLFLWVAIPVIAFALVKNKTVRNTVPILPGIGLIISFGIMSIKKRALRISAVVAVVLVSILQYGITSYGASFLPEKLSMGTPAGEVVFFQQHKNSSYCLYRAHREDWKADEILDVIRRSSGGAKKVRIVLLPRDAYNWMSMEYGSHLRRMPFEFIGAVEFPEAVLNADYVLLKKGGLIAPWFLIANMRRSCNLLEQNRADFTLMDSVVLPERRNTLPIYDTVSAAPRLRSEVVFSDRIQLVESTVDVRVHGNITEYVVTADLKNDQKIDKELMVLLELQNRQMDPIARRIMSASPVIADWAEGSGHSIKAGLSVPSDTADQAFNLQIGFYDPAARTMLAYRPEYMVYKKTAGVMQNKSAP